jgi:hypothetical protein
MPWLLHANYTRSPHLQGTRSTASLSLWCARSIPDLQLRRGRSSGSATRSTLSPSGSPMLLACSVALLWPPRTDSALHHQPLGADSTLCPQPLCADSIVCLQL